MHPAPYLAITPLTDVSRWVRGSGLEIVLIVVGAVLLTRIVTWSGNRITSRIEEHQVGRDAVVASEAAKHRHAVAQVLTWVVIVLIYAIAAVLVVERLGIPVTSLVAPATVAGVAVGFGAQRIVQDVLAGFFILTERQYGFGDVIRLASLGSTTGVTGTVEEVTLRVTRMRTVNGEVVIVPNGQIVQVTNLSRDWARAVIDVPVPMSADVNRVNQILHEVGEAAYADDDFRPLLLDPPSVMGVQDLSLDQLQFQLVARTQPGKQFEVGRVLRSRVAIALRDSGISVPAGLDATEPSGAT